MSEFTCSFTSEDDMVFDIVVKREIVEGEPKIVIQSTNDDEQDVTVKFGVDEDKAILAYLRLLMRMHLETSFGEFFECISIRHLGGQIHISEHPRFKYYHKREQVQQKKFRMQQAVKDTAGDNSKFYVALAKLKKAEVKFTKVWDKHEREVEELRYPYFDKIIGEVSKIFKDLLVLMKDAHEVIVQ